MIGRLYRTYRVESWLLLAGMGVCVVYAIVQKILLSDPAQTNLTGLLGVPLDDVFIHLRYASNLQHGFGYSFNPGEILTADTSPLWVALLAWFGAIPVPLELVTIALSCLCYLIIAPGVYRTARDLFHVSESNARLAGWATVLCSRLAWSAMSGMETSLACLLMLLAVESHIRAVQRNRISAKEAMWLGLGMLLRPEFAIVAIVLAGHWIAMRKHFSKDGAVATLLLLTVIGAPALLLPLTTNNSLLSHSSLVQAATANATPLEYQFFALKTLAEPNAIIALIALVGIVTMYRRSEILVAALVVVSLMLFQTFFAPQTRHHGRYLFPLLPLLILMAIQYWDANASAHNTRFGRFAPAMMLVWGALSTARWAYLSASDVRNINDQHLAAAQWLMQHHRAGDVIAAGDVGAIGYYTHNYIVDPNGLVTPDGWYARGNPDSLWHVLRRNAANVFVIYPRWDRAFFMRYRDSLVPQISLTVRTPLTAAADTTLMIYRLQHGS